MNGCAGWAPCRSNTTQTHLAIALGIAATEAGYRTSVNGTPRNRPAWPRIPVRNGRSNAPNTCIWSVSLYTFRKYGTGGADLAQRGPGLIDQGAISPRMAFASGGGEEVGTPVTTRLERPFVPEQVVIPAKPSRAEPTMTVDC